MKQKTSRHWSPSQIMSYNFFLVCVADELLKGQNKVSGFYSGMSKFISSREPVQCRSHHQKMVGRFKEANSKDRQLQEKKNLKAFYQDQVLLRLLDKQHLIKEIKNLLSKRVKQGILRPEDFDFYLGRAETNLENVDFEGEGSECQVQTISKVKTQEKMLTEISPAFTSKCEPQQGIKEEIMVNESLKEKKEAINELKTEVKLCDLMSLESQSLNSVDYISQFLWPSCKEDSPSSIQQEWRLTPSTWNENIFSD